MLVAVQVPKDDATVLTTRSTERSIWGNSDGRNVTSVSDVVSNKALVINIPNL